MNAHKRIMGFALLLLTSCSLKEEVHLNANNSVDRNMEMHLDKEAGTKMLSMAAMMGQQQNVSLDSLGTVWKVMTDTLQKSVANTPGATFSASPWDTAANTGKLSFHLPNLETYNPFASNSFALPAEADKQMPLGGMKKQQLQWHGKDTLVITLDNSKDREIPNATEMNQALGMVRMMLGVDALVKYKATFFLPKAAKAIIGEDAVLSADKKSITIEKALDEPNELGKADEIKVVF